MESGAPSKAWEVAAMNRRRFIRSVAIGGCGTAFVGSRGLAGADTDGMPTTKRFVEQR
jgi:hypothetical protein